ncbi:MAG: hypothetical protein Fur0024_0720 [Patescibacteria group bacterium]
MIERILKEKISLAKSRFADNEIEIFLKKDSLVGFVGFLPTKLFFENFAKHQNLSSKISAKNSDFQIFKSKKFSDIFKFPRTIRTLPNGKNNLNSQIFEGEVVKGFQIYKTPFAIKNTKKHHNTSQKELIFIETADLAKGWVEKENLEKLENFDEEKFKEKDFSKLKIQNLKVKNFISLKQTFSDFSKKWLETKYLLGGKSLNGIDCSALTQNLFFELFGFLLPRNSFKQAEIFEEKNFENREFLDLIFCKKKNTNFNHIVICIDKNQIFEASLSEKKVCFSDTENFLKKYDIIKVCDVRKIINKEN